VSDIDTAVVDSLKVLDPGRPIREATNAPQQAAQKRKTANGGDLSEIRSDILIRRLRVR
jgi:hypothetical protein